MKSYVSPLRYPGGKTKISSFLEDLILLNNLENCTLYEMYAGGAGASLSLLLSGVVPKIVLNDLDNHIYSFWYSVLYHTEDLKKKISDTKVNLDSWKKQRYVYENSENFSRLEVGFSSFFLNRSNRSGVFNAGPIGGKNQDGNFKIDARFNKTNLIQRIEAIAAKRDSIEIENRESFGFLKDLFAAEDPNRLIFLDPPYYVQGENLYFNFYRDQNHLELAKLLWENRNQSWFLTYDNVERIKELYKESRKALLSMTYSLQEKRKSKEIMIFSRDLELPRQIRMGSKKNKLSLINASI